MHLEPLKPGCSAPRWLRPAALLTPLLPLLFAGEGCESSAYSRAAAANLPQAYRRFLVAYPDSPKVPEVLRRLDRAVFAVARKIHRPLGYRLYLQEFPRGRHATQARVHLATLALKRARRAADLELVIERFPGSPQAEAARSRLADTLAAEALASRAPALSEAYLRRFPASPRVHEVREHLAAGVFARLPPDVEALEGFLARFGGTSWADRAARLLAERMVAMIEVTRDRSLLEQFAL